MKNFKKLSAVAVMVSSMAILSAPTATAGIIGSDNNFSSRALSTSFGTGTVAVAFTVSPYLAKILLRFGLGR